jgi:uncharacterized membrane protein YgcG
LDSGTANIGEIEILGKFSFFEIDKNVVEKLIANLTGHIFEEVSLVVQVSNEKPTYDPKKKRSSNRGSRRSGGGDRKSSFSGKRRSRGGKGRRNRKR